MPEQEYDQSIDKNDGGGDKEQLSILDIKHGSAADRHHRIEDKCQCGRRDRVPDRRRIREAREIVAGLALLHKADRHIDYAEKVRQRQIQINVS